MVKLLPLVLVVALAGGCGREDVKSYSVPKEPPAPPSMPADHPDVSAPQLKWKTPDGWQELQPGEFRVASFKVTGPDGGQADVSVIPLPGKAGGDLSNVNRWRGQVGQSPVTEEGLNTLAQAVIVSDQPATLYEQAGESVRILAVVQNRDGTAWFFKMTGADQLVAQQKPVFLEFLKSFQFVSGPALPAGQTAGKPQWQAPADWTEVPGGQFLVAKFTIAGGQAAVNISSSVGDGGGLVANVNRWRKQLGLSELTGDELAGTTKTIGSAIFVEMTGAKVSLVGAIVQRPGQTWFFKLMGDAKVVATQQDAFTKFVDEVKY